MSKIYKNDIGTVFTVETGSTITGASRVDMLVRKPSGTEDSWSSSVSGTTAITYTIVEDDLDEVGVYKLQAYVDITTWAGTGDTVEFTVHEAYT